MNKHEFELLKRWFNRMKNHQEMRRVKAYQLFLVDTSWGEKIFSNSPTPILSTQIKRFPNYFYQVGDEGYLDGDELQDLWLNMSQKKEIVSQFQRSIQ